MRSVEVAEELLEQHPLRVARLAHLGGFEHATALQLLAAEPLVELEGEARAVGLDATDEVALAPGRCGRDAGEIRARCGRDMGEM